MKITIDPNLPVYTDPNLLVKNVQVVTRTSEYNIKTSMLVSCIFFSLITKLSYDASYACSLSSDSLYSMLTSAVTCSELDFMLTHIYKMGTTIFATAAAGFAISFAKGLLGRKIETITTELKHIPS